MTNSGTINQQENYHVRSPHTIFLHSCRLNLRNYD